MTLVVQFDDPLSGRIRDFLDKKHEPVEAGILAHDILTYVAGWLARETYEPASPSKENGRRGSKAKAKAVTKKVSARRASPTPRQTNPRTR